MRIFLAVLLPFLIWSCGSTNTKDSTAKAPDTFTDQNTSLIYPQEKHFKNMRQLTFEGDNAEAYFSFNNKYLVFQRTTRDVEVPCDQIFYGDITKKDFQYEMISNGKGRTTCAYYFPGNDHVVFASTHLAGDDCPPEIDRSKIRKYVWPIYDSYEIFLYDTSGTMKRQYTNNKFYDAEATLSPDGNKIVFTSNRSGDLELYTMNLDGSDVKQITTGLGYDGGAFFSPDGKKLVFRASRPKTEEEVKEYKDLLAQGLVAPTNMEIYTVNIDGSNLKQVTNLGKANWAPYYHPKGRKILFSSNHASPDGRKFNIYMINEDGSGLEQITFDDEFDSFPMFSYDGKKIVFSSNRNNGGSRDTNIFIADWVE